MAKFANLISNPIGSIFITILFLTWAAFSSFAQTDPNRPHEMKIVSVDWLSVSNKCTNELKTSFAELAYDRIWEVRSKALRNKHVFFTHKGKFRTKSFYIQVENNCFVQVTANGNAHIRFLDKSATKKFSLSTVFGDIYMRLVSSFLEKYCDDGELKPGIRTQDEDKEKQPNLETGEISLNECGIYFEEKKATAIIENTASRELFYIYKSPVEIHIWGEVIGTKF